MVAGRERRGGEGGRAIAEVTGPSEVPPTRKVTVPVAARWPVDTVAVKVMDWPKPLGFGDDVTAVVVAALLMTCGLTDIDPVLPLLPRPHNLL